MEPCIRNQQLKINNEEELRRKRVKTVSVHFKENLNDSSIANIVNVKDHSRNNTIWWQTGDHDNSMIRGFNQSDLSFDDNTNHNNSKIFKKNQVVGATTNFESHDKIDIK